MSSRTREGAAPSRRADGDGARGARRGDRARTGARTRVRRRAGSLALTGILVSLCAQPGFAERRVVRITEDFERVWLHRWLWGENWRAHWSAPIEVEVLDLEETAGGLAPVERVGGMQTLGLALAGANGRAYTFRSLQKDGDALLPGWLRRTPVGALYRDQASGMMPGAGIVASELSRELGLLVTPRRLVVLPDDPRLGTHRAAFADRVGTFSEFPTPARDARPGTFDLVEIVDSETLWRRRREGGGNVDARAYLRARLLDVWIGDWDRHPEQWRWGRREGETDLVPLPEDHDNAFSHYEGAMVRAAARPFAAFLHPFDGDPSIREILHNSRALDAWILAELDREAWMEELRAFEAAIGPALVERAIARLPEGWQGEGGPALREVLLARRVQLEPVVLELYARLARRPHVFGSDGDDRITLVCPDDGSHLALTVETPGGRTLHRVFRADETEGIAVHPLRGMDRLERSADGRCRIPVRVERDPEMPLDRGVPDPAPVTFPSRA